MKLLSCYIENYGKISGETFTFNAMAKALIENNVNFAPFAIFTKDGEELTKTIELTPFAKECESWQITSQSFTAPFDYTSVKIGIKYNGKKQVKVAFMQLYRDVFGNY